MSFRPIKNENDYRQCVRDARRVIDTDKNIICPNFKYIFHAELELNLNWNFDDLSERWALCFTDICLPPGSNSQLDINESKSVQVFMYPPDILIIYHNAKIKYCCKTCLHEWTSARGRAIFQAEVPQHNRYNILYVSLCSQQCRYCKQEILPSWYLDEATRVMKNVCRILIERFYSDRMFELPKPTASSTQIYDQQRVSHTTGHHYQHLCQACREGSCYASQRQYQRRY